MKNNHWATKLLDGKWLYRLRIEHIESLDLQIKELESKLVKLKKQRDFEENELFWKVKERFTNEEIIDARSCVE